MSSKFLFILLIQFSLLYFQEINKIEPFKTKSFDLNEKSRYVIYEFECNNEGTIFCYFNNGYIMSTRVTVYYDDKYKIKYDKDKEEFLNYSEQKNLYNTKFVTFYAHIGKMYFVISNFDRDYKDNINIINNLGYYDITNYQTFKYFYQLHLTKKSNITFSFNNSIKNKNYLYYQFKNNLTEDLSDYSEIKARISNKKLSIEKKFKNCGIIDIRQYKNDIIDIHLIATSSYTPSSFSYLEILIYYSDYYNVFPISYKSNSCEIIPSIREQIYFIFVDISKANQKIYFTIKTDRILEFSGNYHFYESNKINEMLDIMPNYQSNEGIKIEYSIYSNLIELEINRKSQYYKGILFQIKTSYNACYSVSFYKSINVNQLQNITFQLNKNDNNFAIYKFYNPIKDAVYLHFIEDNFNSTNIYIYYELYNIYIDNKNNEFKDYEEKFNLSSNIFELSPHQGNIYILISNFINNYNGTFCIIVPNGYYDITKYQTFEYFYKSINNESNLIFTLSLNNAIKNKNYLYYLINNYQNEQIDESLFFVKDSSNFIEIEYSEYGGIVDLHNYTNNIINMKFNISSTNKFNSMLISIYYSDYKNLHKVPSDEGYLYIPSRKNNEFFIYADISNINKNENVLFLIETELKEISDYYYFYNTTNITDIFYNLPSNYYNYDGYYNSIYLNKSKLTININKTNNDMKLILLKMNISSTVNISLKNYQIIKIKQFEYREIFFKYYTKNYMIFEFENKKPGTIYVYFKNGNKKTSDINVKLYYDIFEIKINKEKDFINYIEKKNLNSYKYLNFDGHWKNVFYNNKY